MSLTSHLEQLKRKHGDLEKEISEALARPGRDDIELLKLKRKKLALKDEITKLDGSPTSH